MRKGGDALSPSGTTQSGKGMQNKSQFRTIAPKIVPKALPSRALPCHSQSLSEHLLPGPTITSKPLVMPSPNYALMQVAGHEGTFSLVALPHVAAGQPIQKPRMALPENLKLPIPRYQPRRNNSTSRKRARVNSENSCSKPPAQTQTPPPAPSHPERPHKAISPDQALSLDEGPVTACTAALPSGGDLRDTPATPRPSAPQEPSAEQTHPRVSGPANLASKKPCSKPSTVHLAKAMTCLSPAVFNNTVQFISSVPKGKLPILPYSRVEKTTEFCKREPDADVADLSLPGHGADCEQMASSPEGISAATKMTDKIPAPPVSRPAPCDNPFCPAPKPELSHKAKLNNGGATRRRARKQKLPDEVVAFQGKRRKCIINKFRDGKERVKHDPQESRNQKPVKKYRSIMPKPMLIMPALASLASPAATLQSHTPRSLGQDTGVNPLLPYKALGYKQNDSPYTKPGFAFRNGCSGTKQPWHICQVCKHHFQFKQHLRDHMNTHTNRRPYSCRICRKTYVRSGSLSTHMKLHHGENRPKRLLCCEFCAKVFGHVRVYFGHLKEVHRVVISTEPSPSEPQPGGTPETRDSSEPVERESKSSLEEDLLLNQVDDVKLQIKCGRCQITTQSFAEIKFHLLYVHGEEIQGRLQEGVLPGSKGAREELVKQAAPSWRQCPERRNLGKLCSSEGEGPMLPKLKRQLYLHQHNNLRIQTRNHGAQPQVSEPGKDPEGPKHQTPDTILFCSRSGFNCLLCTQTLGKREELLLHWEQQHNCEDPSRLWAILNALSNQGAIEFPHEMQT
ncbi:PREDICTED: zinc finger protein 438-like [Chrysochloris asiatica]|uniref:Zinc finger protein 438-like n=1 Tax=Chrysochloris asiatica TaxID=185453 RepID=A0A9B0U0L0_CHRAS|nr:PREDICTED: zinc finger protein 438-like [Chrysochloris asiatica]